MKAIDEAWEKADKFVLNHSEYIGKLTFEEAVEELLKMQREQLAEIYRNAYNMDLGASDTYNAILNAVL